jgi:hypothetical protein
MRSASSACAMAIPTRQCGSGALRDLASRTGMRELALRSLEHRTALGDDGAAAAATLLAADIEAAA